MSQPLLEVTGLAKRFPIKGGFFGRTVAVVDSVSGISFSVDKGETLGLVGESGCGKSTTARCVLRLHEPDEGSIVFEGRDITKISKDEMRALRRDMQIVFQDPYASLNPRWQINATIGEPLAVQGLHVDAQKDRVAELLRMVGLNPEHGNRYPHEFSGGQRQRIGIARALVLHPKFIVCDEPVSALDVSVGAQIVNLLKQLQRDFGLTYLFISHSMPVVRYLSDRIAVMRAGEIVELGFAEQITSQPGHEYTRTLVAATPEPEFNLS